MPRILLTFHYSKDIFYELIFLKALISAGLYPAFSKLLGYIFIFSDPTFRKLVCFAFYIYTLTQNLFLYSVYLARYIQEVYKNRVNEKRKIFEIPILLFSQLLRKSQGVNSNNL